MSKDNKDVVYIDVTEEEGDPNTGFYAVLFRKNTLHRALCVVKSNDGTWKVYLDGKLISDPSKDWRKAFGWIRARNYGEILRGRVLDVDQYRKLVSQRMADVMNGVDLFKTIDKNKTEIQI